MCPSRNSLGDVELGADRVDGDDAFGTGNRRAIHRGEADTASR